MEPVGKFKEDLISTLGEAMDTIGEFAGVYDALSHIQNKVSKMFEEVNNVDIAMTQLKKLSTIKTSTVNTFDVDFNKLNYDFSNWSEPVKPVKGIISVIIKSYEDSHIEFDVGGLVLLMEDGSFRVN